MFQNKYVFAELTSFLNRSKFNRIVAKYDGDKYVKHFTCWNRLFTLIQEREFTFITNAMHISALQVTELYKNHWQVELFFKWLKQHLKIKRFWGTTKNTVRIQIYAAICAYCLVAIIQHDMQPDRSTYEVLQILSISLTDKTHAGSSLHCVLFIIETV